MGETKGILGDIRSRFQKNKMGELLVRRGKLTPEQLRTALKAQKENGLCFGQVVQDLEFVSRNDIRFTLFEQASYRAIMACFAVFVSVVSFGAGQGAKASPLQRGQPSINQSMIVKAAYHPNIELQPNAEPQIKKPEIAVVRPELFGSKEVASSDISAFKKWTTILGKLDKISFKPDQTAQFQALPLAAKVNAVNTYVNKVTYIEDKSNFGQSDYWATPAEFFAKGGDCEDFAIAKYALLKQLGVEENQMRLAIVQDKIKNVPHAILVVYTEDGAMILDNQEKQAKNMASVDRYKPIYSINADGWWRHLG